MDDPRGAIWLSGASDQFWPGWGIAQAKAAMAARQKPTHSIVAKISAPGARCCHARSTKTEPAAHVAITSSGRRPNSIEFVGGPL